VGYEGLEGGGIQYAGMREYQSHFIVVHEDRHRGKERLLNRKWLAINEEITCLKI
jgi:hypothetical protein